MQKRTCNASSLKGKPSLASDQYALGTVVYEWLSGSTPFQGSIVEIISQHLYSPPEPLRERIPTLSPEVEQVVLKALSKDPHQRFLSIQDFANALEEAYRHGLTSLTAPNYTVAPSYSDPTNQVEVPDSTIEDTQRSIPHPELPKESLLSRGASLLKNLEHHAHEITEEAVPVIENLGRQGRKFLQKMLELQDAKAPSPTPPTASDWIAPRGPSTFLFSSSRLPEDELRDFFISYNRADRSWAEWIAWELKEAGYSFIFPIWDFHKGSNFKLEMQKASVKAKRTILVLSPNYLDAYSSQSA